MRLNRGIDICKRAAMAGVIAFGLCAGPAAADPVEDCTSPQAIPKVRIAGCTAAIETGRFGRENLARLYNNRGTAHAASQNFRAAALDYSSAIRHMPVYADAYFNRAVTYRRRNMLEDALADYSLAIELDPKSARAYNNRAMTYLVMGRLKEGLVDIEKALGLAPANPAILDTRAHLFEAFGKKREAIADFRAALKKNPKMSSARDGLKRLGVRP